MLFLRPLSVCLVLSGWYILAPNLRPPPRDAARRHVNLILFFVRHDRHFFLGARRDLFVTRDSAALIEIIPVL